MQKDTPPQTVFSHASNVIAGALNAVTKHSSTKRKETCTFTNWLEVGTKHNIKEKIVYYKMLLPTDIENIIMSYFWSHELYKITSKLCKEILLVNALAKCMQ